MIIAFSGPDGVGKTTLLNEVARELAGMDVKIIIHQEFQFNYLKALNKLRNSPAAKSYKDNVILGQKKPSARKRFIGLLYACAIYVEFLIEYVDYELMHRKTVLLRDRYALDFAVGSQATMTSRLITRLLLAFPRPSLHFLVQLRPEKAMERMRKTRAFSFNEEYYLKLSELYRSHGEGSRIGIDNDGAAAKTLARKYARIKVKLLDIKTVAISGLDGAGKSTTVAGLSQLLTELKVPHVTKHFYYEYLILKLKKKGPDKPDEIKHKESREAEERHVARGKTVPWVIFVLIDSLLQYSLAMAMRRNRIVIFDRFFPDYFVSFDFLRAPYNRKFLKRIFPRPSRYYLQIADYGVLYERKPEHSLGFFKECHKKYMELASENNMILLDSTKNDKDQILDLLVEGL